MINFIQPVPQDYSADLYYHCYAAIRNLQGLHQECNNDQTGGTLSAVKIVIFLLLDISYQISL